MLTKLILIRHGVTDWNTAKRYCGFIDIDLSARGRVQAALIKKRLKQEKIHKVYSSDRKRAIQTAKIIFDKLKVERMPELREMHFGIFEGLTHKQILKNHKKIYRKWVFKPHNAKIPEGESPRDFKKRVISAFKKIISLNRNKTVAVACHGGTIGIFVTHLLKTRDFWKYIPDPASITVIECKNRNSKVLILNDTKHLSKRA